MNLSEPSGLSIMPNSLFDDDEGRVKTVDVSQLKSRQIMRRSKPQRRREFRDLRRRQTAKEAIGAIDHESEIFGFTKGQFSLLDVIRVCLEVTGPAKMHLSTWTAARAEIVELRDMRDQGMMLENRFLLDFSFARRDPEAANMIRQAFGLETVRVAQSHAKFCTFQNDDWKLVLRTSMNLNMNPRYEDFTISDDPEVCDFLTAIMDEIWAKQKKELQIDASPYEIVKHFRDEM